MKFRNDLQPQDKQVTYVNPQPHMQTQIILYSPTSSNAALDIIEPACVSVTVTEYISDCCIIASVFESTPSMTPGFSTNVVQLLSLNHTKHRITHESRSSHSTPAKTLKGQSIIHYRLLGVKKDKYRH